MVLIVVGDCKTESSRQKINGIFYIQDPQLIELKKFTLTKFRMAVKKDNITPLTIKTMETIYGKKLDQVFLEIMRSSRRKNLAASWSGELANSGVNHVSQIEGKIHYENNIVGHIANSLEYFKRHWDDMLKSILLYTFIGFMCVFVLLWIIGTIMSILKNGPRSSLTAKILMAPFYMMVDAITYLLVIFGLFRNQNTIQLYHIQVNIIMNFPVAMPLNQCWNDLLGQQQEEIV